MEATEGILGSNERRRGAEKTYRNYSYQEALDCANSIRTENVTAARETFGDGYSGSGSEDSTCREAFAIRNANASLYRYYLEFILRL